MRVRNGEGFPHLREAGPEALRVADDSVIVEVTGKSAPERRRQFPERTAAVVAHPIELKPEKGEALASLYIASTEAKNAAFLHCHTQAELGQAHGQFFKEPFRIAAVFKADNEVVRALVEHWQVDLPIQGTKPMLRFLARFLSQSEQGA